MRFSWALDILSLLRMQEVRGSNPLISTKDFGHLGGLFFFLSQLTAGFTAEVFTRSGFLWLESGHGWGVGGIGQSETGPLPALSRRLTDESPIKVF